MQIELLTIFYFVTREDGMEEELNKEMDLLEGQKNK